MQRQIGRVATRACRSRVHEQRLSSPAAYDAATCSSMHDSRQHAAPPDQWTHSACEQTGVRQPAPTASAMAPTARSFASAAAELSQEQFHRVADETLEAMLEDIEVVIEDRGLEEADLEYGQGVLTLKLGEAGTYVINKQAPNQQIWLSSPVSGPVRYDYAHGDWVYARDGHLLHQRLEAEFSDLMNGPVSLSRPS